MIRIVRLGTPRAPDEGPRLGTVRRPPRGVPKAAYARRDFYDAWLPELAPSTGLFSWIRAQPLTEPRWRTYTRRYLAEMRRPTPQHILATLATLSQRTNFSVGCYCEDASHCHRSLLRDLLTQAGANVG
jgi:uncharacterized protein YeaO (DUF488 family)